MDQMIQTMQTEIRQLEAGLARLDEQRKEKKADLIRKRKGMKLWTGEKSSSNGDGASDG